MYTLKNESCLNPYVINGHFVSTISFYDDTGTVFTNSSGWFGNNKIEIKELEQLQFNKRNKLNLNKKENMFISNGSKSTWNKLTEVDIYIYIPTCNMVFTYLGEQAYRADNYSTSYNYVIELTATFNNGYKFSKDTLETRKFSSVCHKFERTKAGKKLIILQDYLKEQRIEIGGYELEQLLKNKDTFIKLFEAI